MAQEPKSCTKCCAAIPGFQTEISVNAHGSKYNGEKITTYLCFECIDSIVDSMVEEERKGG